MKIVERKQALVEKLRRYFTGRPCPHGHVAERDTKTCACVMCTRINAKRWANKNRQRFKENQKRYRVENGHALRESKRHYWAKNAESIRAKRQEQTKRDPERHVRIWAHRKTIPGELEKARARAKKNRERNPEKAAACAMAWKRANPERARAIAQAGCINRRARQRNVPGKITAKDAREIRAAVICAQCGALHPKMEVDHIIPISRGGSNHRSNLQLLCRPCNRTKWAKLP